MMPTPFDYQTTVRNRLIALIAAIDPGGVKFRPGTTETPGDATKAGVRGRTAGKVTKPFFPTVEVLDGRSVDDAYNTIDTIGGEDRDPAAFPHDVVPIRQEYFVRVTHADENQARNAAEDRLIAEALRAGGRQLANPATPNSALSFVVKWGPLDFDRPAPRWIKRDVRRQSIATVPVEIELKVGELSGALPAPV
jgi:hypothetical protein